MIEQICGEIINLLFLIDSPKNISALDVICKTDSQTVPKKATHYMVACGAIIFNVCEIKRNSPLTFQFEVL